MRSIFSVIVFMVASFVPLFANPSIVEVVELKRGDVLGTESFVGSLRFKNSSNLSSEVGGVVDRFFVDEGDSVKKGDMLVSFDSEILKMSIEAIRYELESIESNLERAKRDHQRQSALFEKGSISQKSFDDSKYSLMALESSKNAKFSELKRMQIQQIKKILKAPYDGVVLKKFLDIGEWANVGAPVVGIASSNNFEIVLNLPNRVINDIKVGQSVEIVVDSKSYSGEVNALILRGDSATRTFPVKIGVDGVSLIEGMEAVVSIPIGERSSEFVVPRDSIVNLQGKNGIFVIVDDSAMPIFVDIKGYIKEGVIVASPSLEDGGKLVVKGQERLRPNAKVVIKNVRQ